MQESKRLPGDRLTLISIAQQALVEEARTWELMWQAQEERWYALESCRHADDQDDVVLERFKAGPWADKFMLQEMSLERSYRQAQLALSRACQQLSLEIEKARPK